MDDSENHSYKHILRKCGCFQVIITPAVLLPRLTTAMCIYFMAFGAYNPGWKCLDDDDNPIDNDRNDSISYSINTTNTTNQSSEYMVHSCHAFEACQRVEFSPEASTIVTEWGLLCDRSWIVTFIISAMMAGLPVGTVILGYFGDKFGRKWTYCISILSLGVLNLIGMYSVAWQMFAVIRFLMGIMCAVMLYGSIVLLSEFTPAVWRPFVQSFPMWNIGMLIFCVCAMTTQNWQSIHLVTGIMALGLFLPCIWVPESLRWLLTNGKQKKSIKVVKKLAKLNSLDLTHENMIELIDQEYKEGQEPREDNKYTFIDLFKKRFKFTLIIAFNYFVADMVYYATNFSVAVFPGNVYVNMIIMSASEVPSSIVASIGPNLAGRKITVSLAFLFSCLCYTSVAIVDIFAINDVKTFVMLGLMGVGKICLNIAWYTQNVQVIELYPTVLRSTALGFTGFMAGIGSVVAPYLMPSSEDGLYINYFITGSLLLICSILELFLPETKGKPLPDTWEEEFKEFGS